MKKKRGKSAVLIDKLEQLAFKKRLFLYSFSFVLAFLVGLIIGGIIKVKAIVELVEKERQLRLQHELRLKQMAEEKGFILVYE